MSNKKASENDSSRFAASDFKEGEEIAGCFVLHALLFRSDTALVWRARDEVLNRDVSLHFVPDAFFEDVAAMEELRQEVKITRRLLHPRIPRIYDLVEEVNYAAVSMESVEGESLSELLSERKGGHFEVGEISGWVAQLGAALDDAHRANLIHGDLSPSNILVGESGNIVLMNVGLSRCILNVLSRTGEIGTDRDLAYLSPQVLAGDRPAKSDDVYGLGVLAYELITGRPPFYGEDLASRICGEVPPAPDERRRELNVGGETIPAEWVQALQSCLAKNPTERPKGMRELASLLEPRGESVVGANVSLSSAPEDAPTSVQEIGEHSEAVPEVKRIETPEAAGPDAEREAEAAGSGNEDGEDRHNPAAEPPPLPIDGLSEESARKKSVGGIVFAGFVLAVVALLAWFFFRPGGENSFEDISAIFLGSKSGLLNDGEMFVRETRAPESAEESVEPEVISPETMLLIEAMEEVRLPVADWVAAEADVGIAPPEARLEKANAGAESRGTAVSENKETWFPGVVTAAEEPDRR